MITLKYKCTLLSDIIINVKSASEGVNQTLDFIPGSNFMGIAAARLYAENDPDTMLIIHSGQVAFGDAHPLVNNTRSLKMPFAFFYPKSDSITWKCIIHHCYNRKSDPVKPQLKQCREGFVAISPEAKTMEKIEVDKAYSIKSAYDREHRRSADGKMFGYESIPEGMEYGFSVICPTEETAIKIDRILLGRQHIGRSRTAQYGLVKIERCNYDEIQSDKTSPASETVVYAESRLIFFDENGMPTFQPTVQQLGFDKGSIDWSKSQIRTFMYAPWNFKRKSFDFDRCGIEKGSVFVIKEGTLKTPLCEYIGSFRNEGFGKVLYNPYFLTAKSDTNGEALYSFTTKGKEETVQKITDYESPLIKFLIKQKNAAEQYTGAYKKVNEFVQKNINLFADKEFASQWGHIRELANQYSDFTTLKNNINDYLNHGVASEKWNEKRRSKIFTDFLNTLSAQDAKQIIINLASEMAKKCR